MDLYLPGDLVAGQFTVSSPTTGATTTISSPLLYLYCNSVPSGGGYNLYLEIILSIMDDLGVYGYCFTLPENNISIPIGSTCQLVVNGQVAGLTVNSVVKEFMVGVPDVVVKSLTFDSGILSNATFTLAGLYLNHLYYKSDYNSYMWFKPGVGWVVTTTLGIGTTIDSAIASTHYGSLASGYGIAAWTGSGTPSVIFGYPGVIKSGVSLNDVIASTYTFEQIQKILLAVLAGSASVNGSRFTGPDGTIVQGTVTSNGNRTITNITVS